MYSLRAPGSACVTRKGSILGYTPFRVNSDPVFGKLSADLTNNGVRLTQLWVIFRVNMVKLTDFRVNVDPEWSLAPYGPLFRGHADPGCYRVYNQS